MVGLGGVEPPPLSSTGFDAAASTVWPQALGLQEGVEPSSPRYDGGARPTTGAGLGSWIRTSGLMLPKHALCQTELHPVQRATSRNSRDRKALAVEPVINRRGTLDRNRTCAPRFRGPPLFPLSYEGLELSVGVGPTPSRLQGECSALSYESVLRPKGVVPHLPSLNDPTCCRYTNGHLETSTGI